MFFVKGQTATEYIILLSMVLILALIGVGLMQLIPAMNGGSKDKATTIGLQSKPVGITAYGISNANTTLALKNNGNSPISIINITVHNISFGSSTFPLVLYPGDVSVIATTRLRIAPSTSYYYALNITYIQESSGVTMTQRDILSGTSGLTMQ